MTGIIARYLKLENIEPEGLRTLAMEQLLGSGKSRVAFVVLIARLVSTAVDIMSHH